MTPAVCITIVIVWAVGLASFYHFMLWRAEREISDLRVERDLLASRLLEHGEEMTFVHQAGPDGARDHQAFLSRAPRK